MGLRTSWFTSGWTPARRPALRRATQWPRWRVRQPTACRSRGPRPSSSSTNDTRHLSAATEEGLDSGPSSFCATAEEMRAVQANHQKSPRGCDERSSMTRVDRVRAFLAGQHLDPILIHHPEHRPYVRALAGAAGAGLV